MRYLSFHFIPILIGFYTASTGFSSPVPSGKPEVYPDWWFERDVIQRLPASATKPNPVWPTDYPPADDFAVSNIGQLKYIATKAADELSSSLPSWDGAQFAQLVGDWQGNAQTGIVRDDFAALTQGQLKTVASLFYNHLAARGYYGAPLLPLTRYPWTVGMTDDDDYAVVNLGQLKHVFSFSSFNIVPTTFSTDSDTDGIPDWWEIERGLNPFDQSDASLVTGGTTNIAIYQQSIGTGGNLINANSLGLATYTP